MKSSNFQMNFNFNGKISSEIKTTVTEGEGSENKEKCLGEGQKTKKAIVLQILSFEKFLRDGKQNFSNRNRRKR